MLPNREIDVKMGDTLSKLCAEIYGVPDSQTRAMWREFFRKDPITGDFKPLLDYNHIRAGETLFHRPDLAANSAGSTRGGFRPGHAALGAKRVAILTLVGNNRDRAGPYRTCH